ncbi:MAG: hypothetical protein C4326_05125 [Ignavibacteria bacterium]
MTILALADIHGAYERMMEVVRAHPEADALLIAGDLTTHGTVEETEAAIEMLRTSGKPVFAVAGNMDPPELDDVFVRLGVSLNARGVVLNNVGLFGVSAAPLSPLMTPNEIPEEEISRRAELGLAHIASARWKIFVPHAPPFNTRLDVVRSGRHVGSRAVRTFVERWKPDVVVCGHIHEARGIDSIGKTVAINCGPAGQGMCGVISLAKDVVVRAEP